MTDFLTEIAANPTEGHIAAGSLSVTGTATVDTGLDGAITACVANLQVLSAAATHGFLVQVAPGESDGEIVITVYEIVYTVATTDTAPASTSVYTAGTPPTVATTTAAPGATSVVTPTLTQSLVAVNVSWFATDAS